MVDLDDLLAYSTVKIVKIRDKRLGLLHYLFILTIFAYILGYEILYNKKYLLIEQPVGTMRSSLLAPKTGYPDPNFQNISYCRSNPDRAVCIAWDGVDVLYPPTEATAMMVTTRVVETLETQNCTSGYCIWQANFTTPYQYIVDVENFTIMMDHTMNAVKNNIQVNARTIEGLLLNSNGDTVDGGSTFGTSTSSLGDILSVRQILDLLPLQLNDKADYTTGNETYRSGGVVILCLVSYENDYSFNTGNIRYKFQFKRVAMTEFKALEPIYSVPVRTRITRNRHGIRIMFLQTGRIGKFDFQLLLLTFVSGLGLMAVATVIVDLLATQVLPEKEMYSEYKFQITEDFSDARKKMEMGQTPHVTAPTV